MVLALFACSALLGTGAAFAGAGSGEMRDGVALLAASDDGGAAAESEAWEYELLDGKAILTTFKNKGSAKSVEIPSDIDGHDVVGLKDGIFAGDTVLERVTFSCTSLTSMGTGTFEGCTSLKTVSLTAVEEMSELGGFKGCTALESVTIPACVQTLTRSAFEGCGSLVTVGYQDPSSLAEIGAHAFDGCASLSSFEMPVGMTTIGNSAFAGCTSLASVDFKGAGLEKIDVRAFSGCSALKTFHFPSGMQIVGERAFEGCTSLATVSFGKQLPDTFGSVLRPVFSGCSALEMMIFPKDAAFYDRDRLGWKPGMAWLGIQYNDDGTAILDSINTSSAHTSITLPAKVGGSTLTAIQVGAAGDDELLTKVIFPEDTQISKIDQYAFKNCTSLKSIVIPASVTEIGSGAFKGCSDLRSVEFNTTSLTMLQGGTFYDCHALKEIRLPEGMTTLTGNDFYNCTSLESVYLPDTLTVIGPGTFGSFGHSQLMSIKTMRMPDSNVEMAIPKDNEFMGTWKHKGSVVFEVTYGSWADYVWFKQHLDNLVFEERNRRYVPVDIARTDGSVDLDITNPDSTYTGGLKLPTLTGKRWYETIYEFNPITGSVADCAVAPAPGYDCVSVGQQKAIIWGQAPHFTGSRTVEFEITPKDVFFAEVSGLDPVTWDDEDWELDDWDPRPTFSVMFDDIKYNLDADKDYTVSYGDNRFPGEATITLKGQGNFDGTKDFHFTIEKVSLAKDEDVEVSAIPDQHYTGAQITPKPAKVRAANRAGEFTDELELFEGQDYTLEYGANVNVGQGSVTLKGIGDYVKDSRTVTFNIAAPDYSVRYDACVPAGASTTCTGSMEDQGFFFGEKKALVANGYSLPGYDFAGWNTKADGSGTAYADEAEVENLADVGDTVTLYAQWNAKAYEIVFNPGEIGGDEHRQTAYFDQRGTLEAYSDAAFGWSSGGRKLHGWAGTGFGSFYGDGAGFVNLCGEPRPDGSLADRELVAQWVRGGQIVVTVTKDGAPQEGLADELSLVDGSGTEFNVPFSYENGKYTFDPSNASQPGSGAAQLPEGDYELSFKAAGYPEASAHIVYGADSAASAVFAYYTVSLAKDPAYADANEVSISGGEPVAGEANTVVALDGSALGVKTTVAEEYRFDGYTAAGVAPAWEGGDPTKAEQSVKIQGTAAIAAHVSPKPQLTVTPIAQTLTYNGQIQGPGDVAYEDPAEIAEVVEVEGLREGDALASVVLDGQGKDAGDHGLVASGASVVDAAGGTVTGDYIVCYAPGTLTIEPAKATIAVNSASKAAGEADPVFTGTVEGLVRPGDLGEVRYVRTNDDEAPGTYAGVLDAEYTANPNYDVSVAKGDFTIRALYTLRWLDGDGSLLQEKTYVEGEPAPAYDGRTPVKAATAKYSYKFTGWDGGAVEGAVRTFRPLFAATLNKYKVKFVNYDGSVLQSAKVAYGKMPRFVGKTPTRAASARRTFTFKGWAPKVKKVTRAITYKAKYASKARKFAAPIVKLTAKGKRSVVASWTKVAGADGYDVFFSRCDHDGKRVVLRKAGTVKAGDALMWEKAGLKPHASYKVRVRAYVSVGGKKVYVRSSRSSHAYASGGTKARTNAKGVSVNKASVSLAKGGSFQLKARVVKLDERKKLMPANHVARLRYLSSDRSIATVGAEGRIRGVARGTCSVYVIAHNGAFKKVKVKVG